MDGRNAKFAYCQRREDTKGQQLHVWAVKVLLHCDYKTLYIRQFKHFIYTGSEYENLWWFLLYETN
jgi:hypothetical protein